MKKVVNISEMIEVIKEKTHWSEAILAIELGADSKNITAWNYERHKLVKQLKELVDA